MCKLQGSKHAVLDTPDTDVKEVTLAGRDSDTVGQVVVIRFDQPGPCRGQDLGKRKIFYFSASDYEPMKKALQGGGKVSFYGVPGVKPAINDASWQAVGVS